MNEQEQPNTSEVEVIHVQSVHDDVPEARAQREVERARYAPAAEKEEETAFEGATEHGAKSSSPQSPEQGAHGASDEAAEPVQPAEIQEGWAATGKVEGEPASAGADSGCAVRELDALVRSHLEGAVGEILNAFTQKVLRDNVRQRQIDQLHDEVSRHRNGLVDRVAMPLMQGMIQLHNTVGRTLEALLTKAGESGWSDHQLTVIQDIQTDIEVILEQNGVELYREPGNRFEAKRQRVLARVETGEPTWNGQIAQRVRPGFEFAGKVLKKETVTVYVHRQDLASAT